MRAVGRGGGDGPLTLHLDDGDGVEEDGEEGLRCDIAGLRVQCQSDSSHTHTNQHPGWQAGRLASRAGGAGGPHPPAERDGWSVSSLPSSVVWSCRGPFATVTATATATATASASAALHSHATSPVPALQPCPNDRVAFPQQPSPARPLSAVHLPTSWVSRLSARLRAHHLHAVATRHTTGSQANLWHPSARSLLSSLARPPALESFPFRYPRHPTKHYSYLGPREV